jgi:hypothetical protein
MGAEAEGNPPTIASRRRARDHDKGAAHLHSAVRQFLLEAAQGPPESVILFYNFVIEILIPPGSYRDTGKRGKMSSKKS